MFIQAYIKKVILTTNLKYNQEFKDNLIKKND